MTVWRESTREREPYYTYHKDKKKIIASGKRERKMFLARTMEKMDTFTNDH